MGLIAWLLVGLIAGLLARALVPGRDAMGLGATLLLGLVGSLVGGLLFNFLAGRGLEIGPAGLIGSVIGAMIALIILRASRGRTV